MLERSRTNKVRITPIEAFRGVIFDSTGKKLVENISSVDVYVLLDSFKEKEGINDAKLEKVLNTLGGILGDSWKKGDNSEYSSLIEMVYSIT
jgi:cell division protein FtsI/penicillin-binding protein 2